MPCRSWSVSLAKAMSNLSFSPMSLLHGVRRGGIHANFAVPIHGHESKCGIDGFVHDRQIETVPLGNQRPIIDARAAERVDSERNLGIANRRHVDDAFEIVDIGVQVVVVDVSSRLEALARRAFA